MSEESVIETPITPEATAEGNRGYGEALNPEGTPGEKGSVGNPEVKETVTEPEFELSKERKARLSEILEWEKGYLRQQDYTKKTQEISALKKSFEGNFGRLPQAGELEALGKVWKAYFGSQDAKQVIDAIISGGDLRQILAGQPSDPQKQSPEVTSLLKKIESLEGRLSGFTESQVKQQAAGVWSGWVDKQQKAGIQINEEIDKAMAPFVDALSKVHSDWDDNKILDEAYRHATIGDVEKKVVGQVLQQADKAKTQNPPKITPKAGTKPDSQKSYAEIILDNA